MFQLRYSRHTSTRECYRTALHQEDISSREKQYAQRDPLDYHIGDRKGKMGVERIYDRALHGLSGRLRLVKDHAGEILNSRLQRKPQFGHDLILTLNFDLQQQLGNCSGCCWMVWAIFSSAYSTTI